VILPSLYRTGSGHSDGATFIMIPLIGGVQMVDEIS
jgi:hypothetical protein